jgi:branched-chain amino acid transport system substrate-binding protein
MYGGMDATGGPFSKQAKELGIAAKIVGGDGICSPTLADLAGDAVENVICSTVGVPLEKLKDSAAFLKRYKERFNADVQIYSPMSYDAVMVIVDAMKRADSVDPKAILAAVAQTKYSGLTGNIAFDEKGDLKESFITINQFKDKKPVAVDVVKM